MYLLHKERFDRNSVSEGSRYLLFSDRSEADSFARKLAEIYYGLGPLPEEGVFSCSLANGEVMRHEDELSIEFTIQPRVSGGQPGDTYYITTKPVQLYKEVKRLDFWNDW